MKAYVIPVCALAIALCVTVDAVHAQGNRGQQVQNGGVAAGAMQNGAQQRAAGADTAQQAGQLAQMMLMNFDQNGDAALNLLELRAALDALLQRMRMNKQQDAANVANALNEQNMMNQQRAPADNPMGVAGDAGPARAQGGRRGGGGGKGGQGR